METQDRVWRVMVSGLSSHEAVRLVEHAGGSRVEVAGSTDIEAALAVRNGSADVLIGICQSGAGGALAMAIGLLGRDRCVSLSRMGHARPGEEIGASVAAGKVAFGVAVDQLASTVPPLIAALLASGR